jgi:hypothetical protein
MFKKPCHNLCDIFSSKHDSIKGKRILDTAGGNKYEILEKEEREEWGEGGRKEESGREREREW